MALIVWNDKEFSVQVPSIDTQHKKLVDIINELHDAMLQRMSSDKLDSILQSLKSYTQMHFNYEESLLQKINYPVFDDHKKIHDDFIRKIDDFADKQRKGELFLSVQIAQFLLNWLTNHIQVTDKKYSELMIAQGIE